MHDELQTKITDAIDANNGELTWDQLLELVDYRERSILDRTIKFMKGQGTISKVVKKIDGKPVPVLSRGDAS